ncbi:MULTISPECIES: NAD(P)/FAD-dependent oxidoreductase [Aerococcus]|uniref:NAD(P)/FAD-dependent oxidoreductase n=1 Tax=Aerococcus TaxID=1375 RepID=UPI000DCDF4C7|nr:NAD(P)/FAD-dependent oxidoreductase [Aerococcus urinae]MDL5184402.1 NAD(P)/FAD-dependent oxidoreductase [Aerococcus mictus]MBU5611239.1 NAD(P)/FAD-dependent oxidoreductase [Aerococcus urinae]MDK6292109.1 NAD(P)/FAD-dependent oxidoreductase [Aerococcus urinae]MDK8389402.1 NAD(P)/FAD-dependent oxidoreductase [Aerococcus urinae]RAV93667.1 NAD(P)/FAD-dependent oxidoreductase [Aerococcus mictus]
MTEKSIKDLTIIGAGPSGLFAAFYAGMRQLSVQIIDSLAQVGGQPHALYPDKAIFDIGALPQITGKELSQALLEQVKPFASTTSFHFNHDITEITDEGDYFSLKSQKACFYSRAVLIAAGGGAFRPRSANIKNEAEFEGSKLFYTVNQAQDFQGQAVAILGGGDTALDNALLVSQYAKKLYLVHRRDKFRGHEFSQAQLKAKSNVEIITPYQAKAIHALQGSQQVELLLAKSRSQESKTLQLDSIISSYGFQANINAFKSWPIKSLGQRIPVNEHMQTSLAGVYAIGDICTYTGKTQLIASGFGEAPTAINAITHYLYPEEKLAPLHSTTYFKK